MLTVVSHSGDTAVCRGRAEHEGTHDLVLPSDLEVAAQFERGHDWAFKRPRGFAFVVRRP